MSPAAVASMEVFAITDMALNACLRKGRSGSVWPDEWNRLVRDEFQISVSQIIIRE
jgi:hypothetical protein